MILNENQITAIVQSVIFASQKPVTIRQLSQKVRQAARWERQRLAEDAGESFESIEVASESQTTEDQNNEAVAADSAATEFDPISVLETAAEFLINESELQAQNHNEVVAVDSVENDALNQLLRKQGELEEEISKDEIRKAIARIEQAFAGDEWGVELVSVSGGYQFRTKLSVSPYLRDEKSPAATRLSPSALETLAVVAYEQPVTKFRVEEIRGVDASGVLKTLLDKELVRLVGRSEEAGRPLLYGTTARFLEVFSLNGLKDLPSPSDLGSFDADYQSGKGPALPEDGGLFADDDQNGEEEENATDIFARDADDLSADEQAILDELDESLKHLRDVEKSLSPANSEENTAAPAEEKAP